MKILLINPITTEKGMYTSTPNLGLAYIASSLRNSGHKVDLFDGMKKGRIKRDIENRLRVSDYDAAGIQAYTCSVREAQETIAMIRALNPGAVTVAGGAHPSCDPENTLETLGSDYAFRGEGEEGFPKLLKKLEGDETVHFKDIPNLIWKTSEKTICNPLQTVQDIDATGLPAWDLIRPDEYPHAPIGGFVKNFPLATISCSRGCSHNCTYCANALIMGRKQRTRNCASILEEMKLLYHKYGAREFQIIDDCFTSNRSLAISVCKGIIENRLDVSISFPNGIRVESLDAELVQLLEKAGCYSLGLGIESGSQKIIDHMKRGQNLKTIQDKIRMIKNVSKIKLTGFFIVGYPKENERDIMDTIEMARDLPLSRAQFTVWMPVPGSEMTEKLKSEGKLADLQTNKVALQHVNYIPDQLTNNQFKRLLRKAYIRFYFRPKIIFGLLKEIHSVEHLKNILKRAAQSYFIK
ncbi:MAG: B12-binding domain-containing radical SAM protein [Nitrospirota bacterium]|nr:B12-binding domain-containing radical SAM protein [Nitrospirota bacterium]